MHFDADVCEVKKQEVIGKWKNSYPSHRQKSVSSTGQRHEVSHGNVIHEFSSSKDLEQEQRGGCLQLSWTYAVVF